MSDYYGLDGQQITRDEWVELMDGKRPARQAHPQGESTPEDDPTRIGSTHVGSVWVSTVWLGLDHRFGDGPPLIFETMVFGGAFDQEGDRYSTKEQAEAGHAEWCEKVREMQRATSGG